VRPAGAVLDVIRPGMKVSFIIPLYNCLPLTQAMLASLRATLPAGLAHEIILVDDGSTDGTRAWLGSLTPPCRVVLNEHNLGFAGACNRGAAAAQGEFLVFLNNDLVLLPGWLEPMLTLLQREPSAGLVGNVQRNAATGATDHTGIFFTHQAKPAHRTDRPLFARVMGCRRVDAVTGACFALRRALWEKLGGFDEGFVNGGEDVDLALRATAAGCRHFVALRSVVRHHISASAGRNLRNEQNTRRLLQRWQEPIVGLAARDWCREFIRQHWDQSFVYDDHLGRAALACWLGLTPRPPAAVREGVQLAMDRELDRWKQLLDAPQP
jgi:GT2 family glycosyltransferase